MTRTFSKIHGLAGLRIGWAYAPAHIVDALNRMRGPFNVSIAGDRRRRRGARRPRPCRARGRAQRRRGSPKVDRGGREARAEVTPSVGNFVLIHFPDEPGRRAADADAFLMQRGIVLRRVAGLRLAERAPHDHRHRRGERGGDRRPRAIPGRRRPADERADLPAPGADRHRADRLVDRARGAEVRAGRPCRDQQPDRRRRSSGRAELGLGDSYHADPAEAARDADCVILCIPVGASGDVAARRSRRR